MPRSREAPEEALVIATYGRHVLVMPEDGPEDDSALLHATERGKRNAACVGDRVLIRRVAGDQAVVESIRPRSTELLRSDQRRRKLLGANVDQVGIVFAANPPASEELLLRMMVASEVAGIRPTLLANKRDLPEADTGVGARIPVFRDLGLEVIEISARDVQATRARLRDWLAGRTTLLVGESGMGKSTLVNTLVPDAALRTQTISTALASGRHTTTFSRLFRLDADVAPDARIVDTPGFQSFGLAHLSASQLAHAMPEFAPLLGRCRFNDCTHRDEPGCAIVEAAQAGRIDPLRQRLYQRLVAETQAQM